MTAPRAHLQISNMSGPDVVKAVRGRLLTMPMIMISGFAADDDLKHAHAVGVPLLQKPFSVSELRQKPARERILSTL